MFYKKNKMFLIYGDQHCLFISFMKAFGKLGRISYLKKLRNILLLQMKFKTKKKLIIIEARQIYEDLKQMK